MDHALVEQMKHIFEGLNVEEIKKKVDADGLDSFISEAARFAALTGAIAGLGGAITMVVGIPISVINTVVQQFRVTMAVIYVKRGKVTPTFDEFMKIVAVSLGVEIGIGVGATLAAAVAGQILMRLGIGGLGLMIPLFGAAVGAAANYAFIKAIGATLKSMDMSKA
jgi:hypothetical protein